MIRLAWAALLLAIAPSAARAQWHAASSDHFVVYSDDSADRIAGFTEKLERFDATLRFLTKVVAKPVGPANRVTVYVVSDTADVAKLAGASSVAGFYVPRAGGSVAFVPRRSGGGKFELGEEQVLFHEYTHHFMLTHFAHATFPAWFVEGFAEFFATTQMRPDGDVWIGQPPLYRASSFANGLPVSVEKLLTQNPQHGGVASIDAIYAQGWLLTHMLQFDRSRNGQLNRFITAMNNGETPAKAAAAFGDLKILHRDLSRYLRARLRYAPIPGDRIGTAKVAVRALTPGEAAVMKVRIRSKRGVDRKAALALLPLARRAAAPFPTDPAAQVALAEAEYDAGNHALAEAAARRTIAADATSVDGHVYLGRARMAQAAAAKTTDAAQWRDIRRSFLAANAIDADDPEPLMLFYASFAAAGQEPTTNARDALLRAQELGPQDVGLRMTTATMLLRHEQDDRGALARRMLAPVAFAPHGGALAAFAGSLVAAYDAGGTQAARKLLAATHDTDAAAAGDAAP